MREEARREAFDVGRHSVELGVCFHTQADGERLPLVVKDLGSCDLYPATLAHSPNGRFVAVCGACPLLPALLHLLQFVFAAAWYCGCCRGTPLLLRPGPRNAEFFLCMLHGACTRKSAAIPHAVCAWKTDAQSWMGLKPVWHSPLSALCFLLCCVDFASCAQAMAST